MSQRGLARLPAVFCAALLCAHAQPGDGLASLRVHGVTIRFCRDEAVVGDLGGLRVWAGLTAINESKEPLVVGELFGFKKVDVEDLDRAGRRWKIPMKPLRLTIQAEPKYVLAPGGARRSVAPYLFFRVVPQSQQANRRRASYREHGLRPGGCYRLTYTVVLWTGDARGAFGTDARIRIPKTPVSASTVVVVPDSPQFQDCTGLEPPLVKRPGIR